MALAAAKAVEGYLTLVSVVIPCHNASQWIASTLDSVAAQQGVDLDVIVVDDGSSDGSSAIVERYVPESVRIIRQRGLGAGAARNTGLHAARGEYIQYLDADDLLGPTKIAEQLIALKENPRCVAISRTVHFRDGTDPSSGVLDDNGPWRHMADSVEWLLQMMGADGDGSMVHPGAYLVPAEIATLAGPWQEFRSPDDDGEYFGRVLLASAGVVRTEPGVSYYRKHPTGSSLSAAADEELQWGALRSLDLRKAELLAVRDTPRARGALARAYMERAVLAYPTYRAVTRAALKRATELGGTERMPSFGSRASDVVRDLFGWKTARLLNVWRQRLKQAR